MTPEQVDQHCITSRTTLNLYQRMIGTDEAQDGWLTALDAEVMLLEMLAFDHPGKAAKIRRLSDKWKEFRATVMRKLLN